MALDNPVYDLDFETKSLPSGAAYTRSGYAWRVDGNKLRQVPPDMPLWGPKGLIIEDAGTNYVTNCTPQNTSALSNAASYDFPPASGMRLEAPSMAHAGKGLLAAVRQAVDPLPDAPLGRLTCIWAYVEPITAVYVDLGFLDDNSNWTNRVRYSYDDRRVSVIPSSSPDVQPLYHLVSSRGRNDFPIVQIGAMASSGATDRYIGIAPTGDYPNRLKAVLHHLQCENIPGPSSPIVTTSGTGTRGRATLIGTLTGTVFPLTVRIQAIAPVWMGQNQVLWQLDNDSDTGSVAVQRDAAGDLKVICGATSVSLGSVYNGETFAVALSISGSTLLASRDGQATVSATVSPGSVTKERWGHGYASGNAFYGQLARVQRWLAAASSSAVRAMSVDQASPVLTGDTVNTLPPATYAAGFDLARIPSILLESATVSSSGNARLLLVYAGVGKYVYRKAKAGEPSFTKGTRWETLTGAAYVDQDTISISGSNVTAAGNATHLGLPCNYVTLPAATHDLASSRVVDGHGATIAVGQLYLMRLDMSLSRELTGDETIRLCITGATEINNRYFGVSDLPPNQFSSVLTNEYASAAGAAGTVALYINVVGTFATPISIYWRRRMLFDATGLDASECVPDFIDPSVDYGFGAVGVRWVPTKCGNTVAANGVIVTGTGAALPEPVGVQWQPAATDLGRTIVADSSAATVATSPRDVAGLPAIRVTATGAGYQIAKGSGTLGVGTGSLSILCRPGPSAGFIVGVSDSDTKAALVAVNSSGSIAVQSGATYLNSARITDIGNGSYKVEMDIKDVTNGSIVVAPTDAVPSSSTDYFDTAAGLYCDFAANTWAAQAYHGHPIIPADAADTSRLADDPATGLPAIGTGPFTAFVDMTMLRAAIAGTEYPKIFSSEDDGSGVTLYYALDTVYFYKDGIENVNGLTTITVGVRQRFAFRRTASGLVALFVDGVKKVEVSSTPYNSTTHPRFSGTYYLDVNYLASRVLHAERLYYTALSDAQCIAMTTL